MKSHLKIKGLLMGLLGCLLSCSTQKMPEGRLLSMEYTVSGTMAGYQYEMHVKRSSDTIMLRAMKEEYGPLYEKMLSEEELAGYVQIIRDAKMYHYKERYLPLFEVLDGYMWSYSAMFENGSIYSHGSNALPPGDGLERIRAYTNKLLEHDARAVEEDADD